MAKRSRNRDLARKEPKVEAYSTVLIVCEGQKTEKFYFEDLIFYENLSSVNIQIFSGKTSDPVSVVQTALDIMNEQSQYLNFDEVYCVIDRDAHQTFEVAKTLANSNNIQLITSYPSFEYWYLCHFIYSRAPIIISGKKSAGDNCVSKLNVEWEKEFREPYNKARKEIYTLLLHRLDKATQNATNALNDSQANNEPNPSTQVHTLVERLRNIKVKP